jgi:hypothetical protein
VVLLELLEHPQEPDLLVIAHEPNGNPPDRQRSSGGKDAGRPCRESVLSPSSEGTEAPRVGPSATGVAARSDAPSRRFVGTRDQSAVVRPALALCDVLEWPNRSGENVCGYRPSALSFRGWCYRLARTCNRSAEAETLARSAKGHRLVAPATPVLLVPRVDAELTEDLQPLERPRYSTGLRPHPRSLSYREWRHARCRTRTWD